VPLVQKVKSGEGPNPSIPGRYGRLVPPPDWKRTRGKESSDENSAEKAILQGMAVMTEAVRALSANRPPFPHSNEAAQPHTGDPVIQAFETMVGLEYSEVPAQRRSACRIAVLEVINKFKDQ